MDDFVIQTWYIHCRIELYLLRAVSEDALSASAGKGRTVRELFIHTHNVRLMWLQAAGPEIVKGYSESGLGKFSAKAPLDKATLEEALGESADAIADLLRQGRATGTIKGFKHPTAFLGYLISHESHHRGQIEWALKLSGQPLDDKTSYGLWEWGVR